MSNFSPFQTAFQNSQPEASDDVAIRLAKIEARVLHAEQIFTPDGMTGNLTVTGNLSVTGTANIVGTVTVTSYVESGFIFSHFKDAGTNVAPASAEVYHETTATPVAGFGASFDISMDDATVKRQVGTRFISSWTVAADATRTARLRIFMPSAGSFVQAMEVSPTTLGFYGVAAVARQVVPTGSAINTLITALQNLGLISQS